MSLSDENNDSSLFLVRISFDTDKKITVKRRNKEWMREEWEAKKDGMKAIDKPKKMDTGTNCN